MVPKGNKQILDTMWLHGVSDASHTPYLRPGRHLRAPARFPSAALHDALPLVPPEAGPNGGDARQSLPPHLTPIPAPPAPFHPPHSFPQVLGCIGEQFDDGEEICGIVVNVRPKQDRISVWTKTAANEALQTNVGRQLKEMLQIPDQAKIGFMAHADAKRDDRRAKERYTV